MRDPREVQDPYEGMYAQPSGAIMAPPSAERYEAPGGAIYPYAAPTTTNTSAILSLVFGILGFMTLITAIPGAILGHVALNQLKQRPGEEGRGIAIAGLIMSYIVISGFLLAGAGAILLIALGAALMWN